MGSFRWRGKLMHKRVYQADGRQHTGPHRSSSRPLLHDRSPETWWLRTSDTVSVDRSFRGGLAGDSNFTLSCEGAVRRPLGLQPSGGSVGSENCSYPIAFHVVAGWCLSSPLPPGASPRGAECSHDGVIRRGAWLKPLSHAITPTVP